MSEDEPTEGSELLTDINFVVTEHGSTVYDLTTGIQYIYKLDELYAPQVFIWRMGSPKETCREPAYIDSAAVEFWDVLRRRINMDY